MNRSKSYYYFLFFLLVSLVPSGVSVINFMTPVLGLIGGPYLFFQFFLGDWFASFVNPAISPGGSIDELTRWLPVLSLFSYACWITLVRGRVPKVLTWLFLFVFWSCLSSYFKSPVAFISLFKIFSFFSFVFAVFVFFSEKPNYWREKDILGYLETFYKFLIVFSFFALLAGIAYERNGRGFQGIIQHPQAFGIILAPLTVLYAARNLEKILKFKSMHFAWLLVGIVFIYMSASRTAMLSFSSGFLAMLFIYYKKNLRSLIISLTLCIPIMVGSYAAISLSAGAAQELSSTLSHAIYKGYDAQSLGQGFYMSRGFLVEDSFRNIKNNPVFGIGYGMPSNLVISRVVCDPIFGFPISLTVEKGIVFVAVIEEVGIPGAILFYIFLLAIARFFLKGKIPLIAFPVYFSAIMVNVGESVLLSTGGVGYFHWLLIAILFGLSKGASD